MEFSINLFKLALLVLQIPATLQTVIQTRKPAPSAPQLVIRMQDIAIKMNSCLCFFYPIFDAHKFHILHRPT